MASLVTRVMTLPCFSKAGSATIAALAQAVNTRLTPSSMGAEKFHSAVTIDDEKTQQITNASTLSFRKVPDSTKMNLRFPAKKQHASMR